MAPMMLAEQKRRGYESGLGWTPGVGLDNTGWGGWVADKIDTWTGKPKPPGLVEQTQGIATDWMGRPDREALAKEAMQASSGDFDSKNKSLFLNDSSMALAARKEMEGTLGNLFSDPGSVRTLSLLGGGKGGELTGDELTSLKRMQELAQKAAVNTNDPYKFELWKKDSKGEATGERSELGNEVERFRKGQEAMGNTRSSSDIVNLLKAGLDLTREMKENDLKAQGDKDTKKIKEIKQIKTLGSI
jgi:hypothetical protein